MRRTVEVAVALLTLAACSDPGAADVQVAPDTVAWAGEVCTGVTDVRTAIGDVSDGLVINPLNGAEALAEARALLETRIGDVQRSYDELRASIAAAPDDPPAQEARATLDAALTSVESATDEASQAAREALGAESIPAAVSAARSSIGALRDAVTAVGDLIGEVTGTASGTSAEVRAAFDQAPTCKGLG